MNKKNGIGESKRKQSQRQGESAPEMPVGRAYAVESPAVGKVLRSQTEKCRELLSREGKVIEKSLICRCTNSDCVNRMAKSSDKRTCTVRRRRIERR